MDKMEQMNILIVDNDKALQEILTEVLTKDGFSVTARSTAEEALGLFPHQRFDISIIDTKLPGIDGLTMLGMLKELSPDIEVIISTSDASLDSAVSALRSGAYDYLVKPFDDLALVSSLVGRAAEKIQLARKTRCSLRTSSEAMRHWRRSTVS